MQQINQPPRKNPKLNQKNPWRWPKNKDLQFSLKKKYTLMIYNR